MKKLLFCMPLMVLLTSCGENGSFMKIPNSIGFACFVAVGLALGAALSFIYKRRPRRNICTGSYSVYPPSCRQLVFGALIGGVLALLSGILIFHP